MTSIGTVCVASDSAASACTPGTVTVAPASGGADSCGYPSSGFNESTVLCGITASGGGNAPAVIDVFYNDEHALTLGCATSSYPVSALPSSPSAVYYPQTGDPACTDTYGRPMRPVLFVTDITADPSCTSGDQQHGGTAYYPVAVFGSWKSATENGTFGTPVSVDPTSNGWNLGSGADAVPSSAMTTCGSGQGYATEIRFEAGLLPYHSYRLQVMLHDGDQNKGGDSGEGCAIYCAAPGKACAPTCGGCSSNEDCCSGSTCLIGQGEIMGVCGHCVPPSDGGAMDAAPDACAALGQACTVSSDCCNGIPCAGGFCSAP
jgi:hypothetical protein